MKKFLSLLVILLASCESEKTVVIEESLPIIDYVAEVIITKVTDGDTYKFMWKGEEWRIRLLYIDTFETRNGATLQKQADKFNISTDSAKALGFKAKELAEEILIDNQVVIKRDSLEPNFDSFGRLLRTLEVDGADFADILGTRGLVADTISE
jgi:endonuclease YncB( thermonuclease family)